LEIITLENYAIDIDCKRGIELPHDCIRKFLKNRKVEDLLENSHLDSNVVL
jgi:hypothetical protein